MYEMVQVPKFLKIEEAAETFNVSGRVLRTAIQREDIPAFRPNGKTYLVKAEDVRKWIEGTRYSACY